MLIPNIVDRSQPSYTLTHALPSDCKDYSTITFKPINGMPRTKLEATADGILMTIVPKYYTFQRDYVIRFSYLSTDGEYQAGEVSGTFFVQVDVKEIW